MSPSHSNTKAQHFVGLARIDIDELDFSFALQKNHREQSEKAKLRLLSVFKLEGCRRFEEENFIDATIDTENLDLSLRQAQVLPSDFKTASLSALLEPFKIPRLKVHRPVACYNGLHRVLAAKEFLDRNDRWWVIRLHSSEGLTSRSSSRIIEGFAHEQVYTDGTIFRNIRQYNRQEDAEDSENRWWARLTETKRKDLRQLLKNKRMTKAFDELLDFPGLWTPIQLGTLHRLHGLRCPEELVNYLSHIKTVWTHIVPDPRLRQYVDTPTVLNLELYAPGLSSHDDSCVTKLMDEMRIFPMLHAHSDRASLLRSLKSITCLIPSIRTFFENQKYLEPCSTILRQLLGDSEKRSLWLGFSANYFEPDQLCIQQNERFSKRLECHTYPKQTLGYLQLWLFCLRNFPEMTNITPKMTSKREKVRREHNPTLWHKLGKLAVDLGFRTDTAVELSRQSPDAEHADQFLRAARPYWNGNREEAVGAVVELLGSMREDGPATNCSGFTTTEILDRELRCGKPKDNDHEIDKHHLFLSLFHKEVDAGECLTSLYVKRDLIEAFFNPYLLQV
ncbi:hypothetical protein EJ04DRAFT_451086 [Polyplosphaeria fusca]|uniref:Uncharacterized protein n=1 Tax=Polyplosphaeria fusca TaxID=682080 RepID=A0A9P4UW59_9PLEO|nr:hypothetical protein EJ04DRAFT_451086 [Polyplosphaeria fusca]